MERAHRRNQEFSLVHSHYWLSGWVAARLKDEWTVPWFHTAHTLARVKNERAADGAVLEPEHRIAVEQAVTRAADRLIASSYAEAEDLTRLYGAERSRVAVVPPGVVVRDCTRYLTGIVRALLLSAAGGWPGTLSGGWT